MIDSPQHQATGPPCGSLCHNQLKAEFEFLRDKPYVDKKKVRIAPTPAESAFVAGFFMRGRMEGMKDEAGPLWLLLENFLDSLPLRPWVAALA